MIDIIPKLPPADDKYTPEQRRIIDLQLAQALNDIKHGRTVGPFQTHREMIGFLHAQVKSAAKAKRRKTAIHNERSSYRRYRMHKVRRDVGQKLPRPFHRSGLDGP